MNLHLLCAVALTTVVSAQSLPDELTTERRVEFARAELARTRDCRLLPLSIDLVRQPVAATASAVGVRTSSRLAFTCDTARGPVRGEGYVADVGGTLILTRVFGAEPAPVEKVTTERKLKFVRENLSSLVSSCALVPGTIDLTRVSADPAIYVTTRVKFVCVRDEKLFRGEALMQEDGRRGLNWAIDLTSTVPAQRNTPRGYSLVPLN